jgi:hypothetical protein
MIRRRPTQSHNASSPFSALRSRGPAFGNVPEWLGVLVRSWWPDTLAKVLIGGAESEEVRTCLIQARAVRSTLAVGIRELH